MKIDLNALRAKVTPIPEVKATAILEVKVAPPPPVKFKPVAAHVSTNVKVAPSALASVDAATLRVTTDWTVRKYRCEWCLHPGHIVYVDEISGNHGLVRLAPGVQLMIPLSEIEANTESV